MMFQRTSRRAGKPAEKLLERIKAERESKEAEVKGKKERIGSEKVKGKRKKKEFRKKKVAVMHKKRNKR